MEVAGSSPAGRTFTLSVPQLNHGFSAASNQPGDARAGYLCLPHPWGGLARPWSALNVNTIQNLVDMGYSVHAYCTACGHHAEIDLTTLPPGMTVPAMRANLSCSSCMSRHTEISIFQKIGPPGR